MGAPPPQRPLPLRQVSIDEAGHADEYVDGLLATLEQLLGQNTDADWESSVGPADPGAGQRQGTVRLDFWRLQNRLERARLSAGQEARVCAAIDAQALAHPAAAEYLEQRKWMIQHLGIGKVAPEIEGLDLDGEPFRLSECLGKVTYLAFSGAWCGPCRSE